MADPLPPDPVRPLKSRANAAKAKPARRSGAFATALFGYDIFISFALGHPPRGTQSYASDLARQLRERDFTVFFSEDEATPGGKLDSTLRKALLDAKVLVIVANRGMLADPRWVRTELEEFRAARPDRLIVPISIDGALDDPAVLDAIRPWLDPHDTIWLNETQDAVDHGIVSADVVTRLTLAPTHVRTNRWWRATTAAVALSLVGLTIWAITSKQAATHSAADARASAAEARESARIAQQAREQALGEMRAATGLRLRAESAAMLARLRPEPDERALLQLLAAQKLQAPGRALDAQAEGDLLAGLFAKRNLVRIVGGNKALLGMALSPCGERLVTIVDDKMLQMWNTRTGRRLGEPQDVHDATVRSVAFSPDGTLLVSASNDRSLLLWYAGADSLSPAYALPFIGHSDEVRAVAFSPDGRLIASGSNDTTARLWDVRTSSQIGAPLAGHAETVIALAFSPDGHRLVTASYDRTLRLWSVPGGRPIGQPFVGHTDSVRSVAFSPDGRQIVSGGWDNALIRWDAATGRPLGKPMRGHTGLVRSVAFSPDGQQIVSSSDDGSLRLWSARSGAALGAPLYGHSKDVTAARFTRANGERIVSIGLDGSLREWNPLPVSPIGAARYAAQHVGGALAVTADGKRIAASGDDLRLHLWSVAGGSTGNAAHRPATPGLPWWLAPVITLEYSPDGTQLAAGTYDGRLLLLDARSGVSRWMPRQAHDAPISAIAWRADGRQLATGSWDRHVRIWNAASGEAEGSTLTGHTGWIAALAFSPQGDSIAAASADTTLRRWKLPAGEPIGQPMRGHDAAALALAFSPDGAQIVSGSADGTLRRWNAGTGEPIGDAMEGHDGWVGSVAVSPDGQYIVSGGWDHMLRLWRADSGTPIGEALAGHAAQVHQVAFDSEGRTIRSLGSDGALHLWAAPARWQEMLCNKLTRNLTADEWRNWVSKDIGYEVQCASLSLPAAPPADAVLATPPCTAAAAAQRPQPALQPPGGR